MLGLGMPDLANKNLEKKKGPSVKLEFQIQIYLNVLYFTWQLYFGTN